jgi:hypothetical protein
VAVALVELTIVVGRREPFHSTTHLLLKLLPASIMVKPALPAGAAVGESELRRGVFQPHPAPEEAVVCANKGSERTKKKKSKKNA